MTSIIFRLIWIGIVFALAAIAGQMLYGDQGAVAFAIGMALINYAWQARSARKVYDWLDEFTADNIPRVSGYWDDLTARLFRYLRLHQRQQHALTSALVSFRTAAQALPDGVVTLDSKGHIAWCNANAQDHLGLKLSTDIGQPLINLVRNPSFSKYLNDQNWEQPLVMSSPRSRSKILSIQLVSYGDNQMLVLSRDVTKVEKLERMRRDFIANVSHELKTPLTVLSGFLETIRDLPLSPEQQTEYLGLMYTQANRMQNLVEDLLALSALESAPLATENGERVDLSAIAVRTAEDGRQVSGGKHQITAEVEPGLVAMGNFNEVLSAFSNVVTNAVRYTPENGQIDIRLFRSENDMGRACASFVVKDTGIGISPEHIPRLTERFYRVDRSRSRESGGTGLGLAIVKHVVQRHDGQLDIQSKPNQGSTFTIQIPLKSA
ncbi:MAG: phosphate regulon sensor histidine kinase PhoR [Limnobacter sp.]|uniref:phosphate regulon sensor histidine kinase PhoR n=1 Tax=Limnobacter sp. TaxID=2003368 RepID=UPI00391B8661